MTASCPSGSVGSRPTRQVRVEPGGVPVERRFRLRRLGLMQGKSVAGFWAAGFIDRARDHVAAIPSLFHCDGLRD